MHHTALDLGFNEIRALGIERFSAELRNHRYPIDSYTFLQTTMSNLRSAFLSSEPRKPEKARKDTQKAQSWRYNSSKGVRVKYAA